MRMWMVDPKILCTKHLFGEHVEIHMLIGSLIKGRSIQGHLDNGQLEPQHAMERHNELVEEIRRRDMHHQSPLDIPPGLVLPVGHVDVGQSKLDLYERCEDCRENMK